MQEYGIRLSCNKLSTVMWLRFRLTLVKGWNMEEVGNYAELVALGAPDFIEIKGVTYCGSSGASSLTMQNVPYREDVCAFGQVRNTSALCPHNDFTAGHASCSLRASPCR